MNTTSNYMEIALMFVLPFFAVLVPIFIGSWYGRKKKEDNEPNSNIGTVVGAALGLLAFMLAITFQITSNRYESRKVALLNEVTDIRTTYLRAGLIPEPYRSNSRKMLMEYVDLRVEFVKNPSMLNTLLARSQQITDTLWKYAEALAGMDRSSESYALYTGSVNDIIDDFNHRVTLAIQYRIPALILFILFTISFISMLVLGYQFGISGKGKPIIIILLSIIFAVVMFLILALDRTETGLVKANPKPMFTLHQQLQYWQSQSSPK